VTAPKFTAQEFRELADACLEIVEHYTGAFDDERARRYLELAERFIAAAERLEAENSDPQPGK
jgi:hypothetical protein